MSTSHVAAQVWGVIAISSIMLCIGLCFSYVMSLQARTVDYNGEPRIAGTVYTDAAKGYLAKNPESTREQTLFDFAGVTDDVWTPNSLTRSRLILGAKYSLMIALLAFGLNLGIEVLNSPPTAVASDYHLGPKPSTAKPIIKDVHFELDKSNLAQDARERLEDDAALLKSIIQKHPAVRIIVEGHCDDSGLLKHNLVLGYERAQAVKDELIRDGIPAVRLQLASYGKGDLLCIERSEDCRRKNRRVHLTVVD
jgi:outer membrane protein OmpA-like peptidoglycan-associated protein